MPTNMATVNQFLHINSYPTHFGAPPRNILFFPETSSMCKTCFYALEMLATYTETFFPGLNTLKSKGKNSKIMSFDFLTNERAKTIH